MTWTLAVCSILVSLLFVLAPLHVSLTVFKPSLRIHWQGRVACTGLINTSAHYFRNVKRSKEYIIFNNMRRTYSHQRLLLLMRNASKACMLQADLFC
uniref:Putative secreted protein n=1 Tax=Amblyomma parvum TaxID=251391 RepID=A0A023FZ18_AMBPA